MSFEQIIYELDGGILTLTLNRPDRLNAWTAQMGQELIEAFDRADADDDVRAVVVTGAGRAFCAGADLGGRRRDLRIPQARRRSDPGPAGDNGGELTLRIFSSLKPVIAAINGPAVGVGRHDDAADGRPAGLEKARLGLRVRPPRDHPRGRVELVPAAVVGISHAMEWVSTGRVFAAQEALDGGLVRSVHRRRSCSRRRARWPARSPTTPLPSRSRWPAG